MEPEDKEEARFIARLASRDERAFNELVVLYQERVFRILLRMLGRRDEAEDMAQEVFVQIFKAVGTNCDKLAEEITKFTAENQAFLKDGQQYGKVHPEAEK